MRAAIPILLATACGFKGQSVPDDGAHAIDAAPPPFVDAPNPPPTDGSNAVDAGVVIDAAQPDASSSLICPTGAGWVQLGGRSYYFSGDNSDRHFSAAESDCEQRGFGFSATHLAVIDNQTEAQAVGQHMMVVGTATGGVPWAWIGLFQPLLSTGKGTNWRTVTATSVYLNWSNGEPSDGSNATTPEMGTENLAQIYPNGMMNDTKTTDNLHYICECDGIPADPTNLLKVPPN